MDNPKLDSKQTKPPKKKEYDNGTDKTNSTRSNSTMGSRKKAKRQEWEKYFCYINDKEREQMMKLPDLPQKKKSKSRRKTIRRSKSAAVTKSTSVKSPDKVNDEKENDAKRSRENVEVDKNNVAAPFSATRTNIRKINRNKIEQSADSELVDALDSLHVKPTHKYLMRSMKANLDQYLRIREYTNRSFINTQDYVDYGYRARINSNI
ncbi:hypothetical protein BpHYR1_018075 [Brachionus plicatilis]|uniref:Uncharacterized protein n=1 Tax=Brachionus plicatilis TaxID=10195 RepID=A0A3M7R6U7_BRAPC|nr:hypothetical protein BpHYR1_018075 [Brachionus plicatilis]